MLLFTSPSHQGSALSLTSGDPFVIATAMSNANGVSPQDFVTHVKKQRSLNMTTMNINNKETILPSLVLSPRETIMKMKSR
jgi:hypothetical protein